MNVTLELLDHFHSFQILGVNFIEIAVKAFLGGDIVPKPVDLMLNKKYDYVATKVPQFCFTRLAGADPFLGVEMASTGEVAHLVEI